MGSRRIDAEATFLSEIAALEAAMAPRDVGADLVAMDGRSAGEVSRRDDTAMGDGLRIGGVYSPELRRLTPGNPSCRTITVTRQQVRPVLSTAPIMFISGGQRSGKTEAAILAVARRCADYPSSRIAFLLPSWTKFPEYKEKLEKIMGFMIRRFREKTHQFETFTNSMITFFCSRTSSKKQTSYLSYQFDMFIISEIREMATEEAREHFFHAFSRIISRAGRLIIETSPEPGHFAEKLATGEILGDTGDGVEIDVHKLSGLDNPYAKPDAENPTKYFDIAKAIYPPDKYLRDVLGIWAQRADVDFYCFKREVHLTDQFASDATPLLAGSRFYHGVVCRARAERIPIQPGGAFRYIVGLDCGITSFHAVIMRVGHPVTWQVDKPYPGPGYGAEAMISYRVDAEVQVHRPGLLNAIEGIMAHRLLAGIPPEQVLICPDSYALNLIRNERNENVVAILAKLRHPVLFYRAGARDALMSRESARDAVNSKFRSNQITIDKSCAMLVESLLNFKSTDCGDTRRQSADPHGQLPDALKIVVGMFTPWASIRDTAVMAAGVAAEHGTSGAVSGDLVRR